jgi:hypothetical protein
VIVGAIAAGAAVAGGVTWQGPSTSSVPRVIAPVVPRAPVPRRETRPTLDPARFTGKAAQAYRVAREIPEVLDQLQCHCSCGSEYGHVSLLSCYADGHGAT